MNFRRWCVVFSILLALTSISALAQDDGGWDDGGSDWGDSGGDDWGGGWDDGGSDWGYDDGGWDDGGSDWGNDDGGWDDGGSDWGTDDGGWDDGDDDWGTDDGGWDDGDDDWGTDDGGWDDGGDDWGNDDGYDEDVWDSDSGEFYGDWEDEYWYDSDFGYGESYYNEYYGFESWNDPYYWYSYYDYSWYAYYHYYPWEILMVWPYGYLSTSCLWSPYNWGYGWCYSDRVYYTWCAWHPAECSAWIGDPRIYCRYNNCSYRTTTRPSRPVCGAMAGENAETTVSLFAFSLIVLGGAAYTVRRRQK